MITVEKLDVPEGKEYTFEDVVLFHDGEKLVASPKELASVRVDARVVGQGRSEKIMVFKYKPKKGYHKKRGHRQQLTRLEIKEILSRKSAPRQKVASSQKKESAPVAGGEET